MARFGSFDHCGINSNKIDDYSKQLTQFAPANELVEDVEPIDPAITYDGHAFDDKPS